jgi:hypothetical protein
MEHLGHEFAFRVRSEIRNFRPLLAALIALIFYTVTDILVWQRVFEANQLVKYADTYHVGWFVSLAGYAAVGVVIMADRWKDCVFFLVALSVGAFSGLEDVLYYLLDRKPMPAALPWLGSNPLIFWACCTPPCICDVGRPWQSIDELRPKPAHTPLQIARPTSPVLHRLQMPWSLARPPHLVVSPERRALP